MISLAQLAITLVIASSPAQEPALQPPVYIFTVRDFCEALHKVSFTDSEVEAYGRICLDDKSDPGEE